MVNNKKHKQSVREIREEVNSVRNNVQTIMEDMKAEQLKNDQFKSDVDQIVSAVRDIYDDQFPNEEP